MMDNHINLCNNTMHNAIYVLHNLIFYGNLIVTNVAMAVINIVLLFMNLSCQMIAQNTKMENCHNIL